MSLFTLETSKLVKRISNQACTILESWCYGQPEIWAQFRQGTLAVSDVFDEGDLSRRAWIAATEMPYIAADDAIPQEHAEYAQWVNMTIRLALEQAEERSWQVEP